MSLSKSLQNTVQVEKPCEVCEVSKQIQWKCFDCKLYMCSACKETIHPKFKHADKHKIMKTKDITPEDLEEKPDLTSISCTIHDDKLCCLYCKDCENAICSLCVTNIHNKHTMAELSEGYDICLEKIKRCSMENCSNAYDSNETFRAARKEIELQKELERINTDIHRRLKKKTNKNLVVIEIGPTNFKAAFCKSTNNIEEGGILNWSDNKSSETQTSILLDQHGKANRIGLDAVHFYKERFAELTDWYFFENFAVPLYDEKEELTKDYWITESVDNTGGKTKKMEYTHVLSAAFMFISGRLLQTLKKYDEQNGNGGGNPVLLSDVSWMFVVPDMKAKQFMYYAAERAIPDDRWSIALKSDALTEYCRYTYWRQQEKGFKLRTELRGNYLIFDLGDRTKDIVVYEVTGSRFVKEIYRGCCWEGNSLACEAVFSFFDQLFGHDVMNILKDSCNYHFVNLVDSVEFKITGYLDSAKEIRIKIPVGELEKITKASLQDLIPQSGLQKDISISRDMLKINSSFFRSFYENAFKYVSKILDKINSTVGKDDFSNINTVFLVGHLECAPILTGFIKQTLEPSINVIIPSTNNGAIKGAVVCASGIFQ